MDYLSFCANINAGIRSVTENGKKWTVAPCVMLVEGVLNNEYVSAQEISKFAAAWNGRPIVMDHPRNEAGTPISANALAILAQYGIGQVFGAFAEGNKLKAELWIDQEKAKAVEGGMTFLNQLAQNQLVEISTAYWRDSDPSKGTFGNQGYGTVARNLRPDHLAVLLNKKGSCSVEDGCGAPRVNEGDAAPEGEISMDTEKAPEVNEGAEDQELTVNKDQALEILCNRLPDGEKRRKRLATLEDGDLEAIASLLAEKKEDEEPAANEDCGCDEPEVVTNEIPDNIAQLAKELEARGGIGALLRRLDEFQTNENERKAGLVSALVANARCAFGKDKLEAFDLETLQGLQDSLAPVDYSGQGLRTHSALSKGIEGVGYAMPDIHAVKEN